MRAWLAWCVLALPVVTACGGGAPAGPTPPATVTLTLEYVTPVPPEPAPIEAGMCMHHNAPGGLVVARPEWTADLRLQSADSAPRLWRGSLAAPAGREVKLALRDIYRCYYPPSDDGLYVRTGLTLNGTVVTRVGPLSAAEPTVPAFVFTVGKDGGVH